MIKNLKNKNFYIVTTSIACLFAFNIANAADPLADKGDSPEPCSPYPMCKIFKENEQTASEANRLITPKNVVIESTLDEEKSEKDSEKDVNKRLDDK